MSQITNRDGKRTGGVDALGGEMTPGAGGSARGVELEEDDQVELGKERETKGLVDKGKIPPTKPNASFLELCAMTSFNFPYGTICGTMGLFILPAEALRLFPQNEGFMLGIMLGVVGVSQLVCPIAGKVSDICAHSWGRRRPFIFWGTALAEVAVCAMWWASLSKWKYGYLSSLFLGMVALNVIFSAQAGLVPDFVGEERQGEASGIVAVLMLLGSITGFLWVIGTRLLDFHLIYPVYMVLLFLSTVAVMLTAREAPIPSQIGREGRVFGEALSWNDCYKCYTIDMRKHMDFFWVFFTRTFYYMAVSCQAFILYYLRDVLGTHDEGQQRMQIAIIALTGQVTAALVAYPAGKLSDKVGRKLLIYVACFFMSTVYGAFLIAPVVATPSVALMVVFAFSGIYGIGNGCYLSVDYALALDCLPSKESTAQALGIWGISAFVGSSIGPLIGGTVLHYVGERTETEDAMTGLDTPQGGYTYKGYLVMLSLGIVWDFCAAFFLRYIKKSK